MAWHLFANVRMDVVFRIILSIFITLTARASEAPVDNQVIDLPTAIQSVSARLDLILSPDTKTIDISSYQVFSDEAGMTLMAALVMASERGVKVRLLVDNAIINRPFQGRNEELIAYLKSKGIETRFYNPFLITWKDFLSPLQSFRSYNERMHDKLFIVNSNQIILGDKNYGNKYYSFLKRVFKKMTYVKGKEVYVSGEGVSAFSEYFQDLWVKGKTEEVFFKKTSLVLKPQEEWQIRQMFSPYITWIYSRLQKPIPWKKKSFSYQQIGILKNRQETTTLEQIFSRLRKAKPGSRVLIENSYFIFFPELESLLKDLAAKNVEVVLNLNAPGQGDLWLTDQATAIDVERFVNLGAKIYLNANQGTHAKLVVMENENGQKEVMVVSANFDPRSYRINSESGGIIVSEDLHDYYWDVFQRAKPSKIFLSKTGSCSAIFQREAFSVGLFRRLLVDGLRTQL